MSYGLVRQLLAILILLLVLGGVTRLDVTPPPTAIGDSQTRTSAPTNTTTLDEPVLEALSGGVPPATNAADSSRPANDAGASGELEKPAASLVATSERPVDVFGAAGDREWVRQLDVAAEASGKLVFLVKEQNDGWLEVYLPVRPNGTTGWIRRGDVELWQHRYRIEVRLAEHRLRLFHGDELVLDEPIGVGTVETPTPGGVYYIKELIRPPDPAGAYGPYAYGLSGFSPVLTQFAVGDGVIGIHGTDDPSAIGHDVSRGCIRMNNDSIVRLVEEIGLPLGTPVEIEA